MKDYNEIKTLISDIKAISFDEGQLDYDMLLERNNKSSLKEEKGRELSFEEYYLLAFEKYKNMEDDKAAERYLEEGNPLTEADNRLYVSKTSGKTE